MNLLYNVQPVFDSFLENNAHTYTLLPSYRNALFETYVRYYRVYRDDIMKKKPNASYIQLINETSDLTNQSLLPVLKDYSARSKKEIKEMKEINAQKKKRNEV